MNQKERFLKWKGEALQKLSEKGRADGLSEETINKNLELFKLTIPDTLFDR